MANILEMPKMSDTMTVGTLVSWLKNEGDAVKAGDMIAEVETDKATMELECFDEGILLKQYVKVGDQVPIGAPIAAIGNAGEAIPEPKNILKEANQTSENLQPSKNQLPKDSIEALLTTAQYEKTLNFGDATTNFDRIKASPLARKIALDKGIQLEAIAGTGPNGRIVKADIVTAVNTSSKASAPDPSNPAAGSEVIAISNMRSVIAQRLTAAKTEIPHFYLELDVDAKNLLQIRKEINESLNSKSEVSLNITINDFILRATAKALADLPEMNRAWLGTHIAQYHAVHLSFAVAAHDGLVTPVITHADQKSLMAISREAKTLVDKAKNKKLTPAEMSGSTFTITNLGMFGIRKFFGIINPPNPGILAIGGIFKEPAFDQNDTLSSIQRMNLAFSGDHRVIDGAVGARFLQSLKYLLENPVQMLI